MGKRAPFVLPGNMMTKAGFVNTLAITIVILLTGFTAFAQQKNTYPGFNDEINKRISVDSSSRILVSGINIIGNKRTKNYIILREMRFTIGDSILAADLFTLLQQSRDLIYNTSLFSEVSASPILVSATEVIIKVVVLERLYLFPVPQFSLTDRNLNEWLKDYNADLERVTYGIKVAHYNLSGRGDRLRVYILNGYARTLAFSYSAPYSNSALTEGFSIGAGYTQNREFGFKTSAANKLLQYKEDGFSRSNFYVSASYQRRRGFFKRQLIAVAYNITRISDSILKPAYNAAYFNNSKSSASYPDISYSFQYVNTNNVNYPLSGKIYAVNVLKRGLGITGGINMLSLAGNYSKYVSHGKGWYSNADLYGNLKLPFTLAFINQGMLGYRDFYLRGLEYYVVDGQAAAIGKYTLRKKLLAFDIPIPFRINNIPKIPITFYAKAYTDIGYSYNKFINTELGNKLLQTAGFGLDILSLYDTTLKLEYSFNQLGENGIFLHARSLF